MAFNITSHTKPEQITGYTYKGRQVTLNKIPGNVFRPSDHKHWKKRMFPPKVQEHAAVIYAVTGDVKKASEVSKVPVSIINQWKVEPWFQQVLQTIRDENKDKLDSKISEILDTALTKLQERIEDGDQVITKGGEVIPVPVKARDLATISSTLHKQRALDRGEPTSISKNGNASIEDKLGRLAQAFINVANQKKERQKETLDVVDVEIIANDPVPEPLPNPES